MNLSDKDLKKAREQGKNSCGRRYDVGDQRMNKRQIAELTGKSQGYVWTCLQTESADHFINRVGLKKG